MLLKRVRNRTSYSVCELCIPLVAHPVMSHILVEDMLMTDESMNILRIVTMYLILTL